MLHLVAPCQLVSSLHLPNTRLAHYLLGAWVKVLVLNWLIYQGCHTFHKISLFDLKEILFLCHTVSYYHMSGQRYHQIHQIQVCELLLLFQERHAKLEVDAKQMA